MFKKGIILKIFLLLLSLFFIGLGIWQIERSALKYDLQKRFYRPQEAIRIGNTNSFSPNDQYQKVVLKGRFDSKHQFLLAHQFYQHRLGFHVITPFILESQQKAVLVNRGWIEKDSAKNIQVPENLHEIAGLIHFPKQNSYILGEMIQSSVTWPYFIQLIHFSSLRKVLPYHITNFVVLLDPNLPNGFIREWSFSTVSYHRHIGYAIQWFIFALIALGTVLYMYWKNDREKK